MEDVERVKRGLRPLGTSSSVELVERVDLAAWTTLRVGGAADLLIRCLSTEGVVNAVELLMEERTDWVVLGAGSNIVLPDEGLRVPVLTLGGELAGWEVDVDGVVAGAGANLTQVVRAAIRSGLDGLVELFGIPGSVGGGLVMNAGAYGVEIHDRVEWIEAVRPGEGVHWLQSGDVDHGYRWSALGEGRWVVTRARLRLEPGNLGEMNERLRRINQARKRKIPSGFSAGSVFKNPEGDAAGRLLEVAGCKGLTIGRARVSDEHANVILTARGARAADIFSLAREMRRRVLEASGVELEPEVRFLDSRGRGVEL